MPSSPTTLLRQPWDSPHPPVVYGTGPCYTMAFLDRKGAAPLRSLFRSTSAPSVRRTDFQSCDFFTYQTPIPGSASFPCPRSSDNKGCRPLYLLSIGYLCLSLGPDLPRADRLYSGNLGYSAQGFSPCSRYSFHAFSLLAVHIPSFSNASLPKNAPLPTLTSSAASVWCFSPGHFRRRTSRPVSCYALF